MLIQCGPLHTSTVGQQFVHRQRPEGIGRHAAARHGEAIGPRPGQRLAVGAHRAVLDAGQAEFQRHVALEPEAERAVAALPVVEAGVGVDQADANEALIEAAPELYAVARAAEAMLIRQKWRPDPSSPEGALLLALRAVLAKVSEGVQATLGAYNRPWR